MTICALLVPCQKGEYNNNGWPHQSLYISYMCALWLLPVTLLHLSLTMANFLFCKTHSLKLQMLYRQTFEV